MGNQRVSRATIASFRVEQLSALEGLLTDILAALMEQGVLSLETVAVDGMRLRASASAPSFRRDATLQELREQAGLHLKAVLSEADDPSISAKRQAAREASFDRLRTHGRLSRACRGTANSRSKGVLAANPPAHRPQMPRHA